MKQVEYLREYDTLFLKNVTLSVDEREYLSRLSKGGTNKPRFNFDELRTGLRFTSSSWVGVIELSSIIIVIYPKFKKKFRAMTDMICFVEGLPFYCQEDVSGGERELAFDELLVHMFLYETKKVLQTGIVKEYVEEEESLRQLRGR